MNDDTSPIWETLVEIGKSEPSGVWASVPDSTATTQELTASLERAHRFAIVIAARTASLSDEVAEVVSKARHAYTTAADMMSRPQLLYLLEDLEWSAGRAADEALFVSEQAKTVVELAAKWDTETVPLTRTEEVYKQKDADDLQAAIQRHVQHSAETVAKIPAAHRTILSLSEAMVNKQKDAEEGIS